jgi:hypothetical protein
MINSGEFGSVANNNNNTSALLDDSNTTAINVKIN